MKRTLIISDHLIMAGAERLIFELVTFALRRGIRPVILIVNNYNKEYYDPIFEQLNVRVVRTTLNGIGRLRNPVNFFKAFYWRLKLQYFAGRSFDTVQVIGLYNVPKMVDRVNHPRRYFWHVGNAAQYFERQYPFPALIFSDEADTLVYINRYQENEVINQYGKENIKCKIMFFKLFVNKR